MNLKEIEIRLLYFGIGVFVGFLGLVIVGVLT
jgi:hypothetical protein